MLRMSDDHPDAGATQAQPSPDYSEDANQSQTIAVPPEFATFGELPPKPEFSGMMPRLTFSSDFEGAAASEPTQPGGAIEVDLGERYQDDGEIGRGGTSSIRRTFDRQLLRATALKVLDPALSAAPQRVSAFTEEARLTGQLEHPAIVPVHDLGERGDGSHYFSMKLVEGETLETLIAEAGAERLQRERLNLFLTTFVRTCEAVAFAHSRGVIHRDLKPANIMVGAFGQVYVMDWGIAKLLPRRNAAKMNLPVLATREEPNGNAIGTPLYMSPEQARGLNDRLDERTDVFALGAILHHVLTGEPPYVPGPSLTVLVQAHRGQIRPIPESTGAGRIPPALAAVARKATATFPADRFQSVVDLQRAIEDYLHGNGHLPRVRRPAGSVIIIEGEPGDNAYILVEGYCTVFREVEGRKVVLTDLGPGDVFGELAIFSDAPRAASVEAKTAVDLMVVSKETLTEAAGMNTWVGPFVKALAERFRQVENRARALEQALIASKGEG